MVGGVHPTAYVNYDNLQIEVTWHHQYTRAITHDHNAKSQSRKRAAAIGVAYAQVTIDNMFVGTSPRPKAYGGTGVDINNFAQTTTGGWNRPAGTAPHPSYNWGAKGHAPTRESPHDRSFNMKAYFNKNHIRPTHCLRMPLTLAVANGFGSIE